MTRLAEIQSHIDSMGGLLEVVGAMRSLAGMRVQESQRALPGVRSYAESMADAIGRALLLMPQPVETGAADRGGRALILCLAEHGFVGGFNERLLEEAETTLAPSDELLVLGSRGGALAAERGCKIAWATPMATRPAGVPDTVNRLADELYGRIVRGDVGRAEVMFGRYRQGAPPVIERRRLLPLDSSALSVARNRQSPLHNLAPQPLLERLMAEYVFALLTEAAVESIASENAARFAAMQAAHDNVSRKLAGLQENARQARQSEITAELLDLMTGAEAMRPGPSRSSQARVAT